MLQSYDYPRYPYQHSPDQDQNDPVHHPVIVVGAGPVGLCAAIDLARQGIPVVLLDDDDTVSVGSRAICFAKRTLEILDRLGCGQAMVDKGIIWNLGKVFFRERQVYEFNLLPESDHHRPAFINLQQYYFEEYLVNHAGRLENLDLRWKHQVTGVINRESQVLLRVNTPDGDYELSCDYLIVADGARSPIRHRLGLESQGQVFQDRFLIADVIMKADFPTQRWFWFDPPFHPNQSVLLHRQADDVWRIDFQLGWDADPEQEKQPERVIPRIRAMLGEDIPFELEWVSVYTFQCRRMERFRHGRVIFTGDACHQVSPFGARGANGGIQDVDNLIWKLRLVMTGQAPETLLDSYDTERGAATDENILNSTRSTDFISPKSPVSRCFRDAVLSLAEHYPFARTLVNSGRLSRPAVLTDSPLNTPDEDSFDSPLVPGAPALDAPVVAATGEGWLLDWLGNHFVALVFLNGTLDPQTREQLLALTQDSTPVHVRLIAENPASGELPVLQDPKHLVRQRYDATPGSVYLFRPDQHLCARWRQLDLHAVRTAVARATYSTLEEAV